MFSPAPRAFATRKGQMPIRSSPGQRFAAMRATAPLVHCITNYVAMNIRSSSISRRLPDALGRLDGTALDAAAICGTADPRQAAASFTDAIRKART